MKRQSERPIVGSRAVLNERYQEAMKAAHKAVQDPYDEDSEKRQEALEYIKKRKIKVKPLIRENTE